MKPLQKFKKSLGQNFLIDKNIINKIIEIGNINKNKSVMEIGAGYGNLTKAIVCMEPKKILAVEKLCGINPKPRGVWLRMIASELQRIASHLVAIGFLIQDLGAWGTPLTYAMREREKILQMFEMLCGARITNSYVRPGGVFMDAPSVFWDVLDSFITSFPKSIDELEKLITSND